MDTISISPTRILAGTETDTIVKDFKDLGVGDTSKGGGCKDYFNLDYMKAPLSALESTMMVCFFVSFNCSFDIDYFYCLGAII